MKFTKKRVVIGATVAAVVLGGTGVAYGYWTESGSGTGSAATGTTVPITVTQTSTVTGLVPGGPAATLSGKFNNTNSTAVDISGITATVTGVSGGGTAGPNPCTPADFEIGGSSGANTVPVGTGVGSWSGLTVRLVENGANQDNCKGASAVIAYSAAS